MNDVTSDQYSYNPTQESPQTRHYLTCDVCLYPAPSPAKSLYASRAPCLQCLLPSLLSMSAASSFCALVSQCPCLASFCLYVHLSAFPRICKHVYHHEQLGYMERNSDSASGTGPHEEEDMQIQQAAEEKTEPAMGCTRDSFGLSTSLRHGGRGGRTRRRHGRSLGIWGGGLKRRGRDGGGRGSEWAM